MIAEDRIQRHPKLTIIHPKEHRHTLIWIHGLAQHHQKNLKNVMNALGPNADYFKLIFPRAPDRYVTVMDSVVNSWFDIKFRNQRSFIVPFDQSFSAHQVHQSFELVLQPLIEQESKIVREKGGKLIVAGFSQGCGMSIHCLYNKPELVDAAIGISGYFFPITQYDSTITSPFYLIYGLADDLRPWEYAKVTYYGKVDQSQMTFVPKMKHEVNKDTQKALTDVIDKILTTKAKL